MATIATSSTDAGSSPSPHLTTEPYTILGHKPSLWWRHHHLPPTSYIIFCFSSDIWLPWPWPLGLGNQPGSCFVQYTCCYTFSVWLDLAYCVSGGNLLWGGAGSLLPYLSNIPYLSSIYESKLSSSLILTCVAVGRVGFRVAGIILQRIILLKRLPFYTFSSFKACTKFLKGKDVRKDIVKIIKNGS